MEKDLKKMLLDYYQCQHYYYTGTIELEELENNPVTYNGGVDIMHLQQVADYQQGLSNLWDKIRYADSEALCLIDEIVGLLTSMGFPKGKKIPVALDGATKLNFWYDDCDVYYELAV